MTQSTRNTMRKNGLSMKVFAQGESSYGMVGHLFRNGELAVLIFPKCFYVENKEFSLNAETLSIIAELQELKAVKEEVTIQ